MQLSAVSEQRVYYPAVAFKSQRACSPKPIFLAQVLFLARPKAGNNTHKHKLKACWTFVEEFHRARTYARRGEKNAREKWG